MVNRMQNVVAAVGILSMVLVLLAGCFQTSKSIGAKEFYQGSTVNWVVSSGAGSATDLWARAIAPFMAKELGAKVKVEAMGTEEGRNYVYAQGPRDGLTLVIHSATSLVTDDILKTPGTLFEAEKFQFIADVNPSRRMLQVSPTFQAKTLDALRKVKGLKGGGTSLKGALASGAAVAFEILGFEGKVITGYNGKKELMTGITRGEVDFMVTNDDSAIRDEKDGFIANVLVFGDTRSEVVPAITTARELGVKVPKELETVYKFSAAGGTAVAFPPDVPKDRVEYFRQVFKRLNDDKDLQKEMERINGFWRPFTPGEQLQADVVAMKADKDLASRLDAIIMKYTAVQ